MDELYEGLMVDFYDAYIPEEEYVHRAAEAISLIKSYTPSAKSVLELACGTGRFTAYLVKAGFTVTATDISPDEIAKARSKGIRATFDVMDISALDGSDTYDAVACFYESFRYLSSYAVCQETIGRIAGSLRSEGLFLVDFSYFPPTEGVILPQHPVDIGNLRIVQQTTIRTEGGFDVRSDAMHYLVDGKDVTGTSILWNGKTVFLKPVLERSPLLIIPEVRMRQMLENAGFEILEVRRGFAGGDESMLFVAQKR